MLSLSMFLYPLRYFRLENTAKRWLDIWPTLIIAIFIALPYDLIRGLSFFRPNGLLDKTLTLTSCLTGFYVAALVAAATFQQRNLDRPIRSGKITYIGRDMDGVPISEELSRRELACYIFGYLSFLSLALSLLCGFAISASGVDLKHYGLSLADPFFVWARNFVVFMYSLMIAHLVVVTNFGLYYLMSRLWRRDPIITSERPSDMDEAA